MFPGLFLAGIFFAGCPSKRVGPAVSEEPSSETAPQRFSADILKEEVIWSGEGDSAVVEKLVSGKVYQIKTCYENLLMEDPTSPETQGKATTLELTVQTTAQHPANEIPVFESSAADATFEGCVRHRVERWKFPAEWSGVLELELELRVHRANPSPP